MSLYFADIERGVLTLEYAVKARTSLAPLSQFPGSRVTTAHAHQCCTFQSLCEDCAVANEIDYEIDYCVNQHSWNP